MKRRIAGLAIGFLVAGGVLCAVGEDGTLLSVPSGAEPVVDGSFSDGERSDALELPLAGDTSLYAKHAGGFLYLGLRTAPGAQVVGNVYVAREGTIEILHASHALGPATYRLEDGVWRLDRPFVWSCRSLGFSDAAVAEREAFLQEHGWLATVVNLGEPEAMEYQIAVDGERMHMLFRFDVYRTDRTVLTWPLDTDVGVEPGPLPPEAGFRPEIWCDLSFETPDRTAYTVPLGTVPTLDGTLSDGEWSDGRVLPLDGGATLYVKHADGAVFLGLEARTMGVVSPCVLRGNKVHVLHSSAALGTAVYEEIAGAWTRTRDFAWNCRGTGFSGADVREREMFLEREGWLGTIGHLGTRTDFEYRIDLLGDDSLILLFLFLDSGSPQRVTVWPADLSDASEYLTLITGPIPETMAFDPTDWARLALDPTN